VTSLDTRIMHDAHVARCAAYAEHEPARTVARDGGVGPRCQTGAPGTLISLVGAR
jgi:hypothetical protein